MLSPPTEADHKSQVDDDVVTDIADLSLLDGCGIRMIESLKAAGLDTIEKVALALESPPSIAEKKFSRAQQSAVQLMAPIRAARLEAQERAAIAQAKAPIPGITVEIVSRDTLRQLTELRALIKDFLPEDVRHHYFRLKREADKPQYIAVLYLQSARKHRILMVTSIKVKHEDSVMSGMSVMSGRSGETGQSIGQVHVDRIHGDRDFLGRMLQAISRRFAEAKTQQIDLSPMLPRSRSDEQPVQWEASSRGSAQPTVQSTVSVPAVPIPTQRLRMRRTVAVSTVRDTAPATITSATTATAPRRGIIKMIRTSSSTVHPSSHQTSGKMGKTVSFD